MVVHNAAHQFIAGLNAESGSGGHAVPVPFAGTQGWKVLYEPFTDGADFTSATAPKWAQEVNATGLSPAGANGVSLEPQDTTDNSSTLLQWVTPTMVWGAATKKFYFETSVTLTSSGGTVAQAESLVGFTSDIQTTGFIDTLGTAWAWNDGIAFTHLDAATEISLTVGNGGTLQTFGLGQDYVSGTRIRLGCYYDGVTYRAYADGVEVASAARVTAVGTTACGISLYSKNGESQDKNLLVNYIYLASEL